MTAAVWRRTGSGRLGLAMVGVCVVLGLLAAVLTALVPLAAAMAIAAVALGLVLLSTRSLVLSILLMSGAVDFLTRFGVGPISAMGLVTVLYAAGSWGLWLVRPTIPRALVTAVVPLGGYLFWAALTAALWYRPTVDGMQNLFVMAAFVGIIVLSASESRRGVERGANPAAAMGRMLGVATWLAAGLWAATRLLGSALPLPFVGSRSFALFALVGVAWYVAGWRAGSRRSLLAGIGILTMVGLSLSRTALVVGMFLFPLAQVEMRRLSSWLRLALLGLVAGGLLYAAVWYIEPLHTRFFEGDTSLRIGGIGINTEGRMNMWETTLDSYRTAPWFGKGAGSVEELIERHYPGLGHPHNDYLRILHDAGLVGFLLWVGGFLALIWKTWRGWLVAAPGDPAGRVHLAAGLALVAVALGMLTDNVIVYIFVMAPVAVVVGTSLGLLDAPASATEPTGNGTTQAGRALPHAR